MPNFGIASEATQNNITKPQTESMLSTALAKASTTVLHQPSFSAAGSATANAEIICITYKYRPTAGFSIIPAPTAPKMNSGPELLQKASSFSLSALVHTPLMYKSVTHFAPTG